MLKKVCAAMGLVMLMSGAVQAKDLTNLTFVAGAINHPTTVKVFVPFTERANAEFAGKLGITYKAANTLFKETESYNTLNNGIADFGRVRAGSFPDKIHLMGVVDLPGIAPSAVIGSKVAQELMEKFPEVVSEFPEKALPFTAWASASYQIHSVKPIKTFAELKGKTILVWDDVLGEVVKAFGGTPKRVISTTSAKYLESGEADAVICPMPTVLPYKIDKFAKFHTMIGLGVTSFNILVHKPLWESMDKDMQNWMKSEGGMKMAVQLGKCLDAAEERTMKVLKEKGHEFFTFTPEERSEGMKPLDPFLQKWMDGCVAAGFDRRVVEKVLAYAKDRVDYYLKNGK